MSRYLYPLEKCPRFVTFSRPFRAFSAAIRILFSQKTRKPCGQAFGSNLRALGSPDLAGFASLLRFLLDIPVHPFSGADLFSNSLEKAYNYFTDCCFLTFCLRFRRPIGAAFHGG